MRHTSHIMLGANAASKLEQIRQYVLKYGQEEIKHYFKAFLFPELDPTKEACFQSVQEVPVDENVFVAGIDEMFDVKVGGDSYSISPEKRHEYLCGFFRKLYNESITIDRPGDKSELNCCIYVPLYLQEYWNAVKEFLAAIDSIGQSYHVDLFLLPYDTAFLFEENKNALTERASEFKTTSKVVLEDILESKKKKNFESLNSLVMLQNRNPDGVSLNMDDDVFVRIAGEYALLSVSHYHEMFKQSAQEEDRPIHALGLCVLSFDKYYFVQYLLHKAYTHILDRENVLQSEVDVNKVSQIVQSILSKNVKVFSKFYDKEIQPKLNDKFEHAQIISEVAPELNKEIDRLTVEFQSYIDDPALSLPEKKATLAQLLGEDDDLLKGYMFNKKQLVIDDCSREVLDLFVNEHNAICAMNPVRHSEADSEEEPLRDSEVDRIRQYAILSPDKEQLRTASELLDDLKATKVDMRASTNYIRLKSEELEGLDIQRRDHKESFKRLTNEGFVFDDHIYKLQGDIQEIDLDEEYSPLSSFPNSMDLRKDFTGVKDQGNMGACSAFALVGIFEYILKKNRQPDIDLSEQFVYYNARRANKSENLDIGSSLYDVVQTLKKEGVCLEHFFPYNPDNLSQDPPVEAYNDALNRTVVKAKNVKKDINAIKSAISEGYPVAISIRIFDSFNPIKGFIRIPNKNEMQNEQSGNHAMVICGYNDDARFFVVRNSWGVKFGVKGYCYIPYGYIGNEQLLNAACIITEVKDTKLQVKGTDQKTVFSFDTTDSNIKAEIIANLIGEEKFKLDKLTKELTERSRLFNELFQQLGNNGVRESLSDGTIERLDWECRNLTRKKENLSTERRTTLEEFDTITKRIKFSFVGAVAIFAIFYIILCYLYKSLDPLFVKQSYYIYGGMALGSLIVWLRLRYRKRRRQDIDDDYKDRIERIAAEISEREREREVTHLKTHLAGMIIDSLYKLGRNLHSKYNGMRSYLGNLKVWREQEQESLKMTPLSRNPFLTLISNECLDEYFESEKENITKGIELSKMFKDRFNVSEEEVIRFKNDLKHKLVDLLFKAVDSFSIFKYVTREKEYPFVSQEFTDIDELLQQMDFKSKPFVRLNEEVDDPKNLNSHVKALFLLMEENGRKRWEEACNKNFKVKPDGIDSADSPYKITLLQLKGVNKEEVATLN